MPFVNLCDTISQFQECDVCVDAGVFQLIGTFYLFAFLYHGPMVRLNWTISFDFDNH